MCIWAYLVFNPLNGKAEILRCETLKMKCYRDCDYTKLNNKRLRSKLIAEISNLPQFLIF